MHSAELKGGRAQTRESRRELCCCFVISPFGVGDFLIKSNATAEKKKERNFSRDAVVVVV